MPKINWNEELKAGFLTDVRLELDVDKSIVVNPGQGYILKPVLKVTTAKGGRRILVFQKVDKYRISTILIIKNLKVEIYTTNH